MWQYLTFGSAVPTGALASRMRRDLDGFVGHLDQLVPDLLLEDDIYGRDRLTAAVATKDVGAILDTDDAAARAQFLWWNSETQSHWRDGWIRHVLLIGTDQERQAARAFVDRMLCTIQGDGYLGIYAPDLRFPGAGENGELWAQATLGRALLAYVEAAHDRSHADVVLQAVTRAVDVTLDGFARLGRTTFPKDSGGGGSHGLMFVDVLDGLWRLTGEERYLSIAAVLYAEYGTSGNAERDAMPAQLLDESARFEGHGVHTYEHLRALVMAVLAGAVSDEVLACYMEKLSTCITPAGGPIGDEWVRSRLADATTKGYEFCSTVEYVDSLARLMVATERLELADAIERTCFNAAFGAWHPELPAIAYLQTDNAYSMTGNRHGVPEDGRQTRYRYSPVHREAAVCCVPNAGRLLPNLVRASVLRTDSGLVMALYLPVQVRTSVDGVEVDVAVTTEYPNDRLVQIRIACGAPHRFTLTLRKPRWADAVEVTTPPGAHIEEYDDRIEIAHLWQQESIALQFVAVPRLVRDVEGEAHVEYGALVYSLPIESCRSVTREYAVPGFFDLREEPANSEFEDFLLSRDVEGRIEVTSAGLRVPLRRRNSGTSEVIRVFEPLGHSALRRVTFPFAD